MDSKLVKIQNPWWANEAALKEDPHLLAIRNVSYYYQRPEHYHLPLLPDCFHILRGPRQVGKTTLLKQWIERLVVQEKISPQHIFFLSCEGLDNFQELQKTLLDWLEDKKSMPSYLFLDEISFVPQWQRAILTLSNAGLLSKQCLVITGSNARDLKESSERFPGRRGGGKDINLYPFTLAEYLKLPCFKGKSQSELLAIYMQIGGFPHAVHDWVLHGHVMDETYTTYKNWIIGDAARFGLSEEILKHIFFRIAETLSSRITWPKIIEQTPIKSHETALSYLEHLQEAFLCHIHYCYDPNKKGPAFQKARKVYLIDPLLYHLAYGWRKNMVHIHQWVEDWLHSDENKGKLLESFFVVGAAEQRPDVYYWYSTKEKKEVDLVMESESGLKLFEVKWNREGKLTALGQDVKILSANQLVDFLSNALDKPSHFN